MTRSSNSEAIVGRAGRERRSSLSRTSLLGGTAILCLAAGPVAASPASWDISGPTPTVISTPTIKTIVINVGAGAGQSGTLTIQDGGALTLDTADESGTSGIELGSDGTGTLNINGGALSVDVKGSSGVAAGRI